MERWGLSALSSAFEVRRLGMEDVEAVCALCRSNPQYYQYCGKDFAPETIRADMHALPPGIAMAQKYYIGFFDGGTLAAVMDLIDGYPDAACAFIGFFMVAGSLQGQGTGSRIIGETLDFLRAMGMERCRLGIDKGNPQSNHFWRKNGFSVIREVQREDGVILLAQRTL